MYTLKFQTNVGLFPTLDHLIDHIVSYGCDPSDIIIYINDMGEEFEDGEVFDYLQY